MKGLIFWVGVPIIILFLVLTVYATDPILGKKVDSTTATFYSIVAAYADEDTSQSISCDSFYENGRRFFGTLTWQFDITQHLIDHIKCFQVNDNEIYLWIEWPRNRFNEIKQAEKELYTKNYKWFNKILDECPYSVTPYSPAADIIVGKNLSRNYISFICMPVPR